MPLFALLLVIVGLTTGSLGIVARGGWKGAAIPSLSLAPLTLFGITLQVVALQWAAGLERLLLFALSHALLFLFFAANWRHKPLRVLALGFALNLLAILANGGYMPITPEAMASLHPGTSAVQWSSGLVRSGSKDIVLSPGASPFWFLGDVLIVSRPFPFLAALSPGDLVLLVGLGWAMYQFSSSSERPYEPD